MNTFLEIKENVTTVKTDVEFNSFDHAIRFLSFWYIGLMVYMLKLYLKCPHDKCKK